MLKTYFKNSQNMKVYWNMEEREHPGFLSRALYVFISAFLLLVAFVCVAALFKTSRHIVLPCSLAISAIIFLFMHKFREFSALHRLWSAVAIVAVAIVPRILFAIAVKTNPAGDFMTYHLFAGGVATNTMQSDPALPLRYASVFPHTVGFSVLLGSLMRVLSISSSQAAVLIAVFAGAVSSLLTGTIAERVRRGSFLPAGLLFACLPSQIYYTALIATEPAFIMFMLLGVWIITIFIGKSRFSRAYWMPALASLFFAIANAIRPMGLVLAIASIITIAILAYPLLRRRAVERIISCTVLIVVYVLSNAAISAGVEALIGLQTAKSPVGFNLYVGMNAESKGKWCPEDSEVFSQMAGDLSNSPQQIHDEFFKMGLSRFNDTRSRLLTFMFDKFGVMWSEDEESLRYIKSALDHKNSFLALNRSYGPLASAAETIYFAWILLALFSIGMCWVRRDFPPLAIVPSLIVLGICAVHLILEAASRYHAPALPWIVVLAVSMPTLFRQDKYQVRKGDCYESN